jgi:hypothetical protein
LVILAFRALDSLRHSIDNRSMPRIYELQSSVLAPAHDMRHVLILVITEATL